MVSRSGSMLEADFRARIGKFSFAIKLQAEAGITVLFGPSGCGKSSTLNCLAGLLTPEAGSITYKDETFFNSQTGVNLPVQQRRIGYVFQNSCLFPHLTVRENIAFGLGPGDSKERETKVQQLVDLFHLAGLEARRPNEISGGQTQRVALARALATSPRILLLDEPFSSLDEDLRSQLGKELKLIQSQLGLLIVLVTHLKSEAIALGQEVVKMDAGAAVACGTPADVFGA